MTALPTTALPTTETDPPRLAFLGPLGTFAHAALRTLPIAADATLLPMASVTLAIDALRAGQADAAFVPI